MPAAGASPERVLATCWGSSCACCRGFTWNWSTGHLPGQQLCLLPGVTWNWSPATAGQQLCLLPGLHLELEHWPPAGAAAVPAAGASPGTGAWPPAGAAAVPAAGASPGMGTGHLPGQQLCLLPGLHLEWSLATCRGSSCACCRGFTWNWSTGHLPGQQLCLLPLHLELEHWPPAGAAVPAAGASPGTGAAATCRAAAVPAAGASPGTGALLPAGAAAVPAAGASPGTGAWPPAGAAAVPAAGASPGTGALATCRGSSCACCRGFTWNEPGLRGAAAVNGPPHHLPETGALPLRGAAAVPAAGASPGTGACPPAGAAAVPIVEVGPVGVICPHRLGLGRAFV